jgi:hypothetical protein
MKLVNKNSHINSHKFVLADTDAIALFHEIIRGRRSSTKLSDLAKEFGEPFVLRVIAIAIREVGKGKWPDEEFTRRFFNESEENFRQWPFGRGYNKEKLLALLS